MDLTLEDWRLIADAEYLMRTSKTEEELVP